MPIAAQYPGPFLEIAFEYTLEITHTFLLFHVLSDGYMEMTSARSSMASQKVSLASRNT